MKTIINPKARLENILKCLEVGNNEVTTKPKPRIRKVNSSLAKQVDNGTFMTPSNTQYRSL